MMRTSTKRHRHRGKAKRSVARPYRGLPRGPRPETLAGAVGRRIRRLRGDKPVGPLAQRAGLGQSSWYWWESGRAREVSLARLGRIAEALGVA